LKLLSKYRIPKTEEEKKKLNKERLLLILSGILIGFSFPPFPFPVTLLLFVGFIPYLYVLENRKTLSEINRATYLMTIVMTVVTVYWVGSWQSEADTFLMMGGGVLLFALPGVMLIPSTLYYLSTKIFKKKYCFWLFPVFWVTAEYLLTLTDLKFPWVVMGNGLVKFSTFIQAADIIGVFGLSLVVLYINFFSYKSLVSYQEGNSNYRRFALVVVLFFVVFITYGMIKISTFNISERKLEVGIIQPDINPWKKWELGTVQEFIDNYLELSRVAVDQDAGLKQRCRFT
jgi:apolipoprotein N-acyltransferase